MKNVFSTQETKAKAPLVAPQLYGGASTYSGRVASGVGKLAEFAKDIGQGIARNVGSVALSGINLVAGAFGQKPISLESPKDVRGTAAGIQRAVFGEKPVQDIATRTQAFQKEHTALSGPAGSFAPAFVVGGIVLDLTGFGAEKNILSDALLKSKTVEEASNILRKAKVPEQVVEVFAPRFAIANEKKIVDEGIEVMQQLGKSVPEQKTALKSAFTPEDTTRGLSQQSPEQLIPKLEGEQGLLQKTGVVDQKSVSLADNVPGSKVIVNDDDAIAIASELIKHYGDEATRATNEATRLALYDRAAEVANVTAKTSQEIENILSGIEGGSKVGGAAKAVDDPLLAEARKYKTAEEFATSNSHIFDRSGELVRVGDNVDFSYGGSEFKGKLVKVNNFDGSYETTSAKGKEFRDYSPEVTVEATENIYNKGGFLVHKKGDKFKVNAINLNEYKENYSPVKTKSQLTDIWKKANKKAVELPKATSLEQEAKKYKTAEEFVASKFEPGIRKVYDDIFAGYKAEMPTISDDVLNKNTTRLLQNMSGDNKALASFLHDGNKISRRIFEELTGLKWGKDINQTKIREGQGSFLSLIMEKNGVSKSQLTDLWEQAQKTPVKAVSRERGFLTSVKEEFPEMRVAGQYISRSTDDLAIKAKNLIKDDVVTATRIAMNNTDDDAIAQLTKGIQDLKPIREQQEALYSNERARRVAEMVKAREGKSGIESFYAELGALKGALTKVEFESLAGKIDPQVVTRLFDIVRDSPHLRPLESKDAREGLLKLFGQYGATVPTRSEIALLERVFPKATIDALVAKQPLLSSIYDKVVNLAGLSKSLRSIGDLSAPFRQGVVLVGRKEFWKSFTKMFGQAVSPEKYKAVQAEIESLPYYQLMEDLGLPINTSALSIKEEQYIANKWAENLPLVGSVVRASERGYTGFLNYLRASTFSNLITEAKQAGVELTPDVLENLVKFIGNATGRGSLGGLERSAGALSTALFSPRLIASRLSLLNPLYYHKLDPFTRKQAVKSMLSFGAIASAIVIMAKAGGAEVGDDPLSSDFGKIKIKSKSDAAGLFQSSPAFFGVGTQSYDGKIRYDLFGGFQQYIRLAAQLKAGKIVSSTTGKTLTLGEGYKPITRQDIINRFFRGKASPVASFIMNWLDGTDTLGNKFELTPSLINLFVPIMKETIEDAISPPQVEPKKSTRTKATPIKSKSTKPKPTGTSSKMKSAF